MLITESRFRRAFSQIYFEHTEIQEDAGEGKKRGADHWIKQIVAVTVPFSFCLHLARISIQLPGFAACNIGLLSACGQTESASLHNVVHRSRDCGR